MKNRIECPKVVRSYEIMYFVCYSGVPELERGKEQGRLYSWRADRQEFSKVSKRQNTHTDPINSWNTNQDKKDTTPHWLLSKIFTRYRNLDLEGMFPSF